MHDGIGLLEIVIIQFKFGDNDSDYILIMQVVWY